MEFFADIKNAFLPEIIIAGFIFINLLLGFFVDKKYYKNSRWVSILGVLSALASVGLIQAEPTYRAFGNSFICNVYTVFFKGLILITSFFVILISNKLLRRKRAKSFFYFAILFVSILGSMMLVSANDFLSAFLSLLIMVTTSSVLCGIVKKYTAKETALKYFIGGLLSVVILSFGVSYVYGISGTLNFDVLSAVLDGYSGSMLLMIAVLLIISGLTFVISAVPFSSWLPDTFSGASYPVCMFLSLVPVLAGFGLFSRVVLLFNDFVPWLSEVIIILALLTIFFGAYCAVRQKEMKPFLACSTVLHSGFLLLVLGVLSPYSLAGLLYYLICYTFMNIAVWAGVTRFYNSNGRKELEAYKGLAYSHPFFTLAFVFIFMSLAGLPPTDGFLAKFFVFSSVVRMGFLYIIFLLIALLLSVVAIGAYLRPIKIMFERSGEVINFRSREIFSKVVFYFCTMITVLLGVYSSRIVEICELIAYSL